MNRPFIYRLLFIFLLISFQQNGLAAGSSSQSDPKKNLTCLVTTDFYIVHLTVYQPPKTGPDAEKRHAFKPFCKVLPEDGTSFLSLDFLDRDLRITPVGISVVELIDNPEGGEMITGKIIAEVPAKLYKIGVIQIQADFPKPGHYALIAAVGDDMFADKIQIPLRVGIGSEFKWSSLLPYLYLLLVILMSYGIYRFFVYRHKKKQAKI